ncbi:Uncharacterised protein [Streptococcus pneumoniae]|nr:Uncharacterised protein [Streptococcus pneumoniae]
MIQQNGYIDCCDCTTPLIERPNGFNILELATAIYDHRTFLNVTIHIEVIAYILATNELSIFFHVAQSARKIKWFCDFCKV